VSIRVVRARMENDHFEADGVLKVSPAKVGGEDLVSFCFSCDGFSFHSGTYFSGEKTAIAAAGQFGITVLRD